MSERIIERIQKLLALSKSSNVHEAEAATEKAQELMQRYKIEQADVEVTTGVEDIEIESVDYATHPALWQRDLSFTIARAFFCKSVHTPRGKETGGRSWIHIVGKAEDIEVVLAMFRHLKRELKRLSREAYLAHLAWVDEQYRTGAAQPVTVKAFFMAEERVIPPPERRPDPAQWKEAFFNGAVWGLDGRLRAKQREFAGSHPLSTAIVRLTSDAIDQKVESQFKKLNVSPMGEPIKAFSGWVAGLQAARTVALDTQKHIHNRRG